MACLKCINKPPRDIKVIIIGLDDAGKTTLVSSIKGEPPDGITPTVGFANAKITVRKWNVTMYDLGGGVGVRSVWNKYYAEIYGIIFTVDSINKEKLKQASELLHEILEDPKLKGKPLLIFANKQDVKGALTKEQIIEKLSLEEISKKHGIKFDVFTCSAMKGYGKSIDKSINTGLNWLLSSIGENYDVIHEKVEEEASAQRAIEAKDRKERMERIRKLREERERVANEAGVDDKDDDNDEDDDSLVTGNPFRNINQQIEITSKREKKSKERDKKIKAFQESKANGKNGQAVIEADKDEEAVVPKKKKTKKKKKKKIVEGDVLNIPSVTVEEPTPRSCDEDIPAATKPTKKKKKKKKKNDGEEVEQTVKVKNKKNKRIKKKVRKDYKEEEEKKSDISDDIDGGYSSKEKTEEELINDSRVDLFQARSNGSIQGVATKKKKKNKKKGNRTMPLASSPFSGAKKLQPLNPKGRLPTLESQNNSLPSWARARPNGEDHDIVT